MEKLSVTIITFNEESNIERCLKSVAWADEIVVVDSFSSDRTVEICRRYTENVTQQTWLGYGKQKNLCAERASHKWVLNLDADEALSEAGAEEIRATLRDGAEHPVYRFPRMNFFAGRWVRFGGWYPDRIARLYDKSLISFQETAVHEQLHPLTACGDLEEPLLHHSYSGMEDYIARQNRYSSLFAAEKSRAGFTAGWSHLYLRPPWVFFKTFVFRQGFREGFLGVFLALSMAFYTYLKYAKTRDP